MLSVKNIICIFLIITIIMIFLNSLMIENFRGGSGGGRMGDLKGGGRIGGRMSGVRMGGRMGGTGFGRGGTYFGGGMRKGKGGMGGMGRGGGIRYQDGWKRGRRGGRGYRRGLYNNGYIGGGGNYYNSWYNPWYTSWYNPFYNYSQPCKKGCTSIGNDEWGCQYPGDGINECVVASDCYGCG